MRGLGLGDHDQPAGILVEAMHDARPAHAPDPGEARAAVSDQGIDKGPVRVAGGGMDDEPGGLVDDNQMCILETDIERHRLRRRRGILSIGDGHDKILARPDPQRRIPRGGLVLHDKPLLDQPLEPGARQRWQMARQHAVEALAGFGILDTDRLPVRRTAIGAHGGAQRRPGHPQPTPRHPMRALTVFVIVMGVVIIVGFGVVAAVIAGRMSRGARPASPPTSTTAAASTFATSLDLPRGARIEAMTTAPNRLILELALPDNGNQLVVLDLATGARLGTIELRQAR